MAYRHLLTISAAFTLATGCTTLPKMDARHDPSQGLALGEGRLSGTYLHPLQISRPVAFPWARTATLVFTGVVSKQEIRIKTGTDGAFEFRAPAGPYRLSEITGVSAAGKTTIKAATEALVFEIIADQRKAIGTLHSSCDLWNDSSETTERFRAMVMEKKYTQMVRYEDSSRGCLVFVSQ